MPALVHPQGGAVVIGIEFPPAGALPDAGENAELIEEHDQREKREEGEQPPVGKLQEGADQQQQGEHLIALVLAAGEHEHAFHEHKAREPMGAPFAEEIDCDHSRDGQQQEELSDGGDAESGQYLNFVLNAVETEERVDVIPIEGAVGIFGDAVGIHGIINGR